jgi:hypothetical protein
MHVAIVLTGRAYLPEAYAYRRYLTERGHRAECVDRPDAIGDADIAIVFSIRDQWAARRSGAKVVHEYHSLSTGKFKAAKHLVKRMLAPRPAGRIFLNDHVAERYGFQGSTPAIVRPMGIDAEFFDCAVGGSPDKDIVYCGSLGRRGVLSTIAELARRGFTLLVIGDIPDGTDIGAFAGLPVEFTGQLPRDDLPAALARARFGLNVTPDAYPYNIQTSTKTIEYAAAGLGIISNRYRWIDHFARERSAAILWLDRLTSPEALAGYVAAPIDVTDLLWSHILDEAGFERFLLSTLEAGGANSFQNQNPGGR